MFELWDKTMNSLQQRVTSQNYDVWLKPIECASINDSTITLQVPNRFYQEYITSHLLDVIRTDLYENSQKDFDIQFKVSESKSTIKRDEPLLEKIDFEPQEVEKKQGIVLGNLNPRYRFDTFIVGPSNQLAHAGCMAVSKMMGKKYNPLFIYGGVGLGKTHLVHAVGRQLSETDPQLNIYYISSEQFMNEFITSVRNQSQPEFQNKYRHECDVLLMDDIQFIAGKDRTQDEFFHTFNSLYDQQKQIIVTCDKYPQEIDNLEERLRSRFQWGLIADIQPPELETRIAIVKKKAEDEEIFLPDDVALFLAENIRSNVRELEGSLIRLAAQASIDEKRVDLDFARHVLKNAFNLSTQKSTIEDVQKAVCTYYNVRVGDLKGKSRQQSVTLPRMVCMYLCRKGLGSSFPEIGDRFGGRDHSTVMNACKKISRVIESDLAVRSAVDTINRKLFF